MVPFNMMVYLEDQDKYVPDDEVPKGARVLNISGTELARAAERRARDSAHGSPIPKWCRSCAAVSRRVTSRA